ncbi:hypothetical protein [Alicyclobacillus fastidiosus]|uniref:Uncharacterized protein n=1 Tax=Alicyclobacillus fastidiosus TaxID=392011 RepID=A0ABV5AAS0_9BACL|nr:hypothetical protein [Alicyclobacillus fastidiosus]WEH11924.1 hypothetical protein PYS47_12270 [Alicyclobacillus fastidiosus]
MEKEAAMDRDVADAALLQEYIQVTNKFGTRRLIALAVVCLMLLAPLFIIQGNGWSSMVGGEHIGDAWIVVGICVAVCAVGAVVLDLVWRRND